MNVQRKLSRTLSRARWLTQGCQVSPAAAGLGEDESTALAALLPLSAHPRAQHGLAQRVDGEQQTEGQQVRGQRQAARAVGCDSVGSVSSLWCGRRVPMYFSRRGVLTASKMSVCDLWVVIFTILLRVGVVLEVKQNK